MAKKRDVAPKSRAPRSNADLYHFHRPRLHLHETPHPLKQESKLCLRNLAAHRTPGVPPWPRAQSAAVLVAIFVGRMGDLYVLLSRRASTLRTYAGDTALPGGKVDPEDRTIEDTARREAFEEIGLPRDKQKVPLLCVLEPFLAGNQLLVTPVVVLILDNTLRPILNTPEVHTLFSHPLGSFLSSNFPSTPALSSSSSSADEEAETVAIELKYHTYSDVPWPWAPRTFSSHASTPKSNPQSSSEADKAQPAELSVRMHRFLTGRESGGVKPIFGLTAAILIRTATLAYSRTPDFLVYAPTEPTLGTRVAWTLRHPGELLRTAFENEGFDERAVKRAARAWDVWEGSHSLRRARRSERSSKL